MPLYAGLVQGKRDIEASYLNVLLTVLASGPVVCVALVPGIGAPSLTSFASNAEDQQWVDQSWPFQVALNDMSNLP